MSTLNFGTVVILCTVGTQTDLILCEE